MDAQMAGDLVAMMRPVTKWSTMVQHPSSLLRMLRRAHQDRGDAADGPGLRLPARRTFSTRRPEEGRPTSMPVDACRARRRL